MAQFPQMLGPSYPLPEYSADCQSTVNIIINYNETTQKSYAVGIPGLKLFIECKDVPRAIYVDVKGYLYIVEGQEFVRYQELEDYANNNKLYTERRVLGGLETKTGRVSISENGFQICVSDGENLYLYIYADDTFKKYEPEGWEGSNSISYNSGYFAFIEPNSQKFYISSLYDGTNINSLDFASAETSPDNLVTSFSGGGLLYLLGTNTIEVVSNTGDADFPFSKSSGGSVAVGCIAPYSVKSINNSMFWIGKDNDGFGMVYANNVGALSPIKISNFAVDAFIQKQKNIEKSTAYVYQENGHNFYCLNFEDGDTTWCFDLDMKMWHERRYLKKSGEETRHIVEEHVIFNNKHIVSDYKSKKVYIQSLEYTDFDGSPIRKYRRSTQIKADDFNRMNFNEFILDLQVGSFEIDNAKIYLRYSNDGGYTWSNYLEKSLGNKGQYTKRVRWRRLGNARNRVWELSCSDPVKLVLLDCFIN